jgi:hypothetical protein
MSKLTTVYPFAKDVLVGDVIVSALERHRVLGVSEKYDGMIYVLTEDGEWRAYYLDEPVTVVRVASDCAEDTCKQFHLKDTVDFEYPRMSIVVSTCDTPDAGLETCIFFKDGSSVVVAHYIDIEAAVVGHHSFVQRDVARFIATNPPGPM